MKKLLIQLDTDKHPSTFDRIVPYDCGVDAVLSYGGVTAADVGALLQGAFFTRGVADLKHTAVWIGGASVAAGEELLAAAQQAFFGPFKVSLMLDSNGCNTTAATAVAKLAKHTELSGLRAVVVGLGAVGLRTAALLARAGCAVAAYALPADALGAKYSAALTQQSLEQAQTFAAAFGGALRVAPLADGAALERALDGAAIAVTAGPAGVQLLRHALWAQHPTLKVLLDFNLTEPLGIEGIKASDNLTARDSKTVLGALGIGNAKMKVHKACIARLFAQNDLVLDAEGVYAVAKELV